MATATQIVKNKPVATVGPVAVVAEGVTAYLAAKGYIPVQLSYIIAAVIGAVLLAIIHALVSPYQKVKAVIERGLNITDADYGRLEAVLEQYGLQIIAKDTAAPQVAAVAAAADAAATPPAAS